MNTPFFLYMAEAEGLTDVVDTRQAKINAIIKGFQECKRSHYDIRSISVQDKICRQYGQLSLHQLTEQEKRYIASAV